MALANLLSALTATNALGNSATIPSNGTTTDASLATVQPVTPTPQGASVVNKATKAANPPTPKQPAIQGPTQIPFLPPSQPQPWQAPMAAPQQQSPSGSGQGPINEMSPAMALLNFLTHPAVQAHIAAAQGAPQPPTAQSTGINDYSVNPNFNATSSPQVGNPAQNYFQTGQDQSQQPGGDMSQINAGTKSLMDRIEAQVQKNMPVPPTFQQVGPWEQQQQFMNLLQQANQMRTQAASQPVPQQQHLSPLMALVAGALATGDRSGKFANNFLQNFNSSAQTANQGALQQYQETQNAANLGAQLPEQEAQNLLQQRTQAFQQTMDANKNALEQYKAELGYNGKGNVAVIRAETAMRNVDVQSQAKQTAATILSQSRALAAGTMASWKVFGDPLASEGQKQAAFQQIVSDNPTVFGGLSPEATETILKSASPKAVELLAKADTDKARAAFLYGKTDNLGAEKQLVLAQIGKIQEQNKLTDAQVGLVLQQVRHYDAKFQVEAAKTAAETLAIKQKIENGGLSDPMDQVKIYSAANAALKDSAELAQKQINELNRANYGPPKDGTPDAERYHQFQNGLRDTNAQLLMNEAALRQIQTAPPVKPNLNGAVGSAGAHNAGPVAQSEPVDKESKSSPTPWNTMYSIPGKPAVRGDAYYLALIHQGWPAAEAQVQLRKMYNHVSGK